MIKNDPMRKQLRRVILGLCAFIPLILILLFQPFGRPGHSRTPSAFGITALVLIMVGFIMLLIIIPLILSAWKRVDRRRELARQGDQSLLATEQPMPNEMALPVPAIIRLRFKPRFFLLFLPIPMVIVLAIFMGTVFLSGSSRTSLIILGLVLALTLLIFMIVGAMTYAKMRRRTPYQIEVTKYGLNVIYNGQVTIMGWKDAQLFAVSGINKPKRPKLYELSNPDTVARWIWLPRDMYFFYPIEPEASYEEYNQKMQALLEYIEAKTHLPLYDLTETTNKWYL